MREKHLHNKTPTPSFYTPLGARGRQKNERRGKIFENVDKRLSVPPSHLPKGIIKELNSVHFPWSCSGHFFNTGLPLSRHPQPFNLFVRMATYKELREDEVPALWLMLKRIALWMSPHFTIIKTNSGKGWNSITYPCALVRAIKIPLYINQTHILDIFLEPTQTLLYSRGLVKNKSCVFWPSHD